MSFVFHTYEFADKRRVYTCFALRGGRREGEGRGQNACTSFGTPLSDGNCYQCGVRLNVAKELPISCTCGGEAAKVGVRTRTTQSVVLCDGGLKAWPVDKCSNKKRGQYHTTQHKTMPHKARRNEVVAHKSTTCCEQKKKTRQMSRMTRITTTKTTFLHAQAPFPHHDLSQFSQVRVHHEPMSSVSLAPRKTLSHPTNPAGLVLPKRQRWRTTPFQVACHGQIRPGQMENFAWDACGKNCCMARFVQTAPRHHRCGSQMLLLSTCQTCCECRDDGVMNPVAHGCCYGTSRCPTSKSKPGSRS